MAIGGLDIGSSGAKITVLEKDGRLLYTGYSDYPAYRGAGVHEINAADIWSTAESLLKDAAEAVPGLTAVGVMSFGESFVLLDENDGVLLPVMMYTDPRGGEEAKALTDMLGRDVIADIAGVAPHPMYSLPKLMWVKKNRPKAYAAAKQVCLIGDYVVYRLTGRRVIDYSLAARTMAFDVKNKNWSESIFGAAGIDPGLFSAPVPTGTDAGCVLPRVARELGLPGDLHVVMCSIDQIAAAVGSDAMEPGLATDGGGSTQCITPIYSPVPDNRSLQDNNYAIVPFLRDNTYCSFAFLFTGGSLVKWFVDNFAGLEKEKAAGEGKTVYRYLEEKMADGPTGILVLPHFAGAATPYMDTGSKGAFLGLDLWHTPVELFRAVMEGITYEMRLNIERLKEAGIIIDSLNATGGCAKSRLWLQMKADILGVPVRRMSADEAGTVGGIMMTGVATGVYKSYAEAAGMLVKPVETYLPREEARNAYEKHYSRYKSLYGAVRPLLEVSP